MINRGNWLALTALMTALTVSVGACDDDNGPTDVADGPPPAPSTVSASVNTDGTVTVTWSEVPEATSYDVERNMVGSGIGFTSAASGVTETSFTDGDVQAGSFQYRVISVNGFGSSAPSSAIGEVTLEEEGPAVAILSGDIEDGETRVLSSDTTYLLRGTVLVREGGTIRISAGTTILGDLNVQPTALIVRQGGQIFSEGTADAPVIFTSAAPVGERRRGDWGGVIINGRSLCNFPSGECVGEGNAGPYGGDEVNDDSGRMVYTRVEYAGFEVSFGNELNALTLNGVGRGTELHHLQTHYGLDDGFEWFGGTVDLKYAIATGISDDSFDYSTGWQGRGQFWIAQQDPSDADQGFEVDGNEDDFDAEPFTNPTIYNVTLVGNGPGGTGGEESDIGILLRRGTAGEIRNAIVIGFGDAGVDLDNDATVNRIDAGLMSVQNSIFFENRIEFSDDDDGIDERGILMQAGWNNRVADPGLAAPYDRNAPDFRPMSGSAALSGFATPPADGFFEAVDFLGGVDPSGTPWYEGWITLDQG